MVSARVDPSQHLCPCLVVPEGMELVFAVRDLLKPERQQVSFSIVDLSSQPLSHVIVNEVGSHCSILVQLLDQTPLAWVGTNSIHERPGATCLDICRPSGEVFCSISRDEPVPRSRYILRDTSGQRIYTVYGDIGERAIKVIDSRGHLACDTERWTMDLDGPPHFQVR